ncbi:MAG: MBL fold metallo-hydrolase [Oscillibacter sp.]|nr:MBL fold metallo-hydrolase [Oscillibacter sp.]
MEIIVHRGTHQIGGCATEIRTSHTRILIDFGAELPDESGYLPPDHLEIDGLNTGEPNFDAVLLTHYHGDHMGLIAKIPDSIPVYLGRSASEVHRCYAQRMARRDPEGLAAAQRIKPLDAMRPLTIGDIRVTPLPADHSAWDAMMFLIESEGKKILHTGDFRLHGFRGKATLPLLEKYAAGTDLLIMEGTRLSGGSHAGISERELQGKIKEVIRANKYVFALCASTNIDRLASLQNATPRGRYFLCDTYQKDILEAVRKRAISEYYRFPKVTVYGKNLEHKLRKRGFVMAVRGNSQFAQIAAQYPDAVLIYSMWEGYLDGRSPLLSDFVKPFADSGRLLRLHTSGHAAPEDLKAVCDTVKPAQGVIPIHSQKPEEFPGLGLNTPTIFLTDGEVFAL